MMNMINRLLAAGISLGFFSLFGCDRNVGVVPKNLAQLPAVAAVEASGTGTGGSEWAQWRGPEQNGTSREKDLPVSFDPSSGENVAWHNPAVSGMSSPVVMKGRLYTWTRVG